jgi:DNA-nicking Smr family endonuclease
MRTYETSYYKGKVPLSIIIDVVNTENRAAQAYNRHDARAAKALSLRGQAENNLMREAHRKAAQLLYDERNIGPGSRELFVDLHGLHAEEAVDYLSKTLRAHENVAPMRPIYAITGTGHHSRNGRDKIGKAVKAFLGEWRYVYREFATPGDRGMGGVVGIDPTSWDRSLDREAMSTASSSVNLVGQSTKVLLMKKDSVEESGESSSS